MPFVNIKITKEGNVTREQKAALIKGATQLLVDVLGKNPKSTVVIIDEVEMDSWGLGGDSITVVRSKAKEAKRLAEKEAKAAEKQAKKAAKEEKPVKAAKTPKEEKPAKEPKAPKTSKKK